jgi:hypothetical protein
MWVGDDELLCFPPPDNPWSSKGWAAFFSDALTDIHGDSGQVFVRFGRHSNIGWSSIDPAARMPLVMHEVVVRVGWSGGTSISAIVRDLPVARMEAAANVRLSRLPDMPTAPDDFPFISYGEVPHPGSRWAVRPDGLAREAKPALRLSIPGARKKPNEFYECVADLYLRLSVTGNRPANELAQANSVPVTQVHGWIKEARRRGILPPGQRPKGSRE